MSTRAIVSGALHKAAEERTSVKTGKRFATLTIRENVNGSTRWWQCICFTESVIGDLKELAAGAPISVAGEIDAEIYAPAGSEGRINWRITVDAVLLARKSKQKPRKADGRDRAATSWAAPSTSRGKAPVNNEVPFAPECR
jgi:hypothetical protein